MPQVTLKTEKIVGYKKPLLAPKFSLNICSFVLLLFCFLVLPFQVLKPPSLSPFFCQSCCLQVDSSSTSFDEREKEEERKRQNSPPIQFKHSLNPQLLILVSNNLPPSCLTYNSSCTFSHLFWLYLGP